jgi:hypothetical protein
MLGGITKRRSLLCLMATALAVLAFAAAASAASQVVFNDPASSGPIEPTEFGPPDGGDYVQHATWSSWGDAEASGRGLMQPVGGGKG